MGVIIPLLLLLLWALGVHSEHTTIQPSNRSNRMTDRRTKRQKQNGIGMILLSDRLRLLFRSPTNSHLSAEKQTVLLANPIVYFIAAVRTRNKNHPRSSSYGHEIVGADWSTGWLPSSYTHLLGSIFEVEECRVTFGLPLDADAILWQGNFLHTDLTRNTLWICTVP